MTVRFASVGLRGSLDSFLAAGLSDYLPILLMGVLAVVFAVASLGASALLRPHRPNRPKLSAYESGNDPVRLPGGERFSVKFYVVAIAISISAAGPISPDRVTAPQNIKAAANATALFRWAPRAALDDDHFGADVHALVQIDDILVAHPDAA